MVACGTMARTPGVGVGAGWLTRSPRPAGSGPTTPRSASGLRARPWSSAPGSRWRGHPPGAGAPATPFGNLMEVRAPALVPRVGSLPFRRAPRDPPGLKGLLSCGRYKI